MLRINRVELSAYCHATEDEEKVVNALLSLIPSQVRGRIRVSVQRVKGYYGNTIAVIRAAVSGEQAVTTLKYIASMLGDAEKSIIRASFSLRFDPRSNRFYLRFDKQGLVCGRLIVSDSDDIVHVTVSFRGRGGIEEAERVLREVGLI